MWVEQWKIKAQLCLLYYGNHVEALNTVQKMFTRILPRLESINCKVKVGQT